MNIVIEGLYKEYGQRRVLDVSSLEFGEGLIYAVLGLNGSGKTTLLECIAGINKLSGGTIRYNNKPGDENTRQNISIMMQKPYLFNDSVINNILIGLKFRNYKKDKAIEKANRYLGYFNINDLLNKNAKALSGGESAKVALLRTAIIESEVTMLDEPTASMDIESTLGAERLIKDMAGGKRSVIMVTHDIYQAKRLADYVVFLDKGIVIESGEKEKVFRNPKNKLVKFMLNSDTLNA